MPKLGLEPTNLPAMRAAADGHDKDPMMVTGIMQLIAHDFAYRGQLKKKHDRGGGEME